MILPQKIIQPGTQPKHLAKVVCLYDFLLLTCRVTRTLGSLCRMELQEHIHPFSIYSIKLGGQQELSMSATAYQLCPVPAFPCPTPLPQTLLTCELSNLLWEGALCWVLVLGWRAGQMALKLLLLLENANNNRKQQDPHKTKTKRLEKSKLSKFVTQRDSYGDNARNLIWGTQ